MSNAFLLKRLLRTLNRLEHETRLLNKNLKKARKG
jgi:hypothetical protein